MTLATKSLLFRLALIPMCASAQNFMPAFRPPAVSDGATRGTRKDAGDDRAGDPTSDHAAAVPTAAPT